MRLVIIGNGVAGMQAALTVREHQPDWPITIISEESQHFFSRTALMWVFTGQMSHQDIEPYERDIYTAKKFSRIRARAVEIDTKQHTVKLAGPHADIPFDKLLIACGSRPRPAPWPGADLRGVGHFVTLQDLAWLEAEIYGDGHRPAPPNADGHLEATNEDSPYRRHLAASATRNQLAEDVAVIGGGLIGLEAVEILLSAGRRPHFFVREEWFWPLAIDSNESRWITKRMQEHGVAVHLECEIEGLSGDDDGCLTHIRTQDGTWSADCAVVAIGVMPNTQWLARSTIPCDERGGIIVDAMLETQCRDIYAAGDCASVRWFDGSHRPEQLWYTARDQGTAAALNILGEATPYLRGIPYNAAKLMDIEYTTVGMVNMNLPEEANWFFEETGRVHSTTRIVVQHDRVIGFNFLGRRWDHEILIRWIEEERHLSWVLDHLNAASFDTEFVPNLNLPSAEARSQYLESA